MRHIYAVWRNRETNAAYAVRVQQGYDGAPDPRAIKMDGAFGPLVDRVGREVAEHPTVMIPYLDVLHYDDPGPVLEAMSAGQAWTNITGWFPAGFAEPGPGGLGPEAGFNDLLQT